MSDKSKKFEGATDTVEEKVRALPLVLGLDVILSNLATGFTVQAINAEQYEWAIAAGLAGLACVARIMFGLVALGMNNKANKQDIEKLQKQCQNWKSKYQHMQR